MREKGVVTAFYDQKGYGFIRREACADLFFHVHHTLSGVAENVRQGVAVEFEVHTDFLSARPHATGVTLLG